MKHQFIFWILIFNSIFIYSQRIVEGIVKDKFNMPLVGVSIIEKNNIAYSDTLGKFHITISKDSSILNVTDIGFKAQDIKIENNDFLCIVLEQDSFETTDLVLIDRYYVTSYSGGLIGGVKGLPFGISLGVSMPYVIKIPIMISFTGYYLTDFKKNKIIDYSISRRFFRDKSLSISPIFNYSYFNTKNIRLLEIYSYIISCNFGHYSVEAGLNNIIYTNKQIGYNFGYYHDLYKINVDYGINICFNSENVILKSSVYKGVGKTGLGIGLQYIRMNQINIELLSLKYNIVK